MSMRPAKDLEIFLSTTWGTVLNETFPVMKGNLAQNTWLVSQKAGMGMFLGDIYKAVEQSLRAIIEDAEGKKIPKNESWHINLLESALEFDLIPAEVHTTLRGMLRYRHMLMHGYGVRLNEEFIRQKAPEAMRAFELFIEHIAGRYDLSPILHKLRENRSTENIL